MKKSLIWITAGIATVGFAVPAFAARGDSPEHIAPAPVTVATAAPTMATSNTVSAAVATVASTDDNAAHNATDDNGIDNTTSNSVDDNGLDDATTNSVEDISGPCDEAEHASDPACVGGGAPKTAGIDDLIREGLGGIGVVSSWGLTEFPTATSASVAARARPTIHAVRRPRGARRRCFGRRPRCRRRRAIRCR